MKTGSVNDRITIFPLAYQFWQQQYNTIQYNALYEKLIFPNVNWSQDWLIITWCLISNKHLIKLKSLQWVWLSKLNDFTFFCQKYAENSISWSHFNYFKNQSNRFKNKFLTKIKLIKSKFYLVISLSLNNFSNPILCHLIQIWYKLSQFLN